MEFSINGKTFFFGRKPNEAKRETVVVYENNSFNRGNSRIEKTLTRDRVRRFAKTPYCRRAINLTKNGLLDLNWRVVKKDLHSDTDYSNEIRIIENCLKHPNYTETFRSLLGSAIEDILTGDCGAIEVCVGGNPEKPIWLYPVDGYSIQLSTDIIRKPTDIRYIQSRNDGTEVKLADEDLMYFKMNDFTYTPLGLSPVETAFKIINYLLETQNYAGTVTSNAVPKYLLNLGKDIDKQTLIEFRKYFDEDVYGSGRTPIVGGSDGIKSEQISTPSDEGLYLKWQHFLITIIAFSFGIDPKRFNEGSQTDRSTVDEQKQNIFDEAIRPLANMIAEQINKKVIARLGYDKDLVFEFIFEDNEERKKAKSSRILDEFNSDILTVNETRQLLGYEKLNNDLTQYGDMLKTQYKTALNIMYAKETQQDTGGFNGSGKNRHDSDKNGGDND